MLTLFLNSLVLVLKVYALCLDLEFCGLGLSLIQPGLGFDLDVLVLFTSLVCCQIIDASFLYCCYIMSNCVISVDHCCVY